MKRDTFAVHATKVSSPEGWHPLIKWLDFAAVEALLSAAETAHFLAKGLCVSGSVCNEAVLAGPVPLVVLTAETLGTVHALADAMTDVALSILALIAGGLTLELFAGAPVRPAFKHERGTLPDNPFPESIEDFPAGNPS